MSKPSPLILEDIHKSYKQGDAVLQVLKGANLEIRSGEMVALIGESGSGKSTLLQIAGLLDNADSGRVMIAGQDATKMRDRKRTKLRQESLGFVYQFHHLLPDFSALENVMIPQVIAGVKKKQAKARATELLEKLKLGERLKHRPGQMSGGEQQRVAIARALANHPALLLADEPTGNLDPATADGVFAMLIELAVSESLAMMIVTHNRELAMRADRVVTLSNGTVVPFVGFGD